MDSAVVMRNYWLGLAVTVMGLTTCLWLTTNVDGTRRELALAVGSISAIAANGVALALRRGSILNVLNGLLLLFAIFHFGIVIPVWIGAFSLPATLGTGDWFYSDVLAKAVLLSATGIWALLLGGLMIVRAPTWGSIRSVNRDSSNPWYGRIGAVLLVGGCAVWIGTVFLVSGVSPGSSYVDFLTSTRGTALPYAYLAIGIGIAFVASASSGSSLPMALFAIYAIACLSFGARSEVLAPVFVYLVVRARFGKLRFAALWPLVILGLLSAISVIRQIRISGFGDTNSVIQSLNPMDGLVELGFSLRPVVAATGWVDTGGETFSYWTLYWGWILRSPVGQSFGYPLVAASDDVSVLSTAVSMRVGQIGGSMVAEAYRGGSVFGVAIILFIIGILSTTLDRLPVTAAGSSWCGAGSFILFTWARNDFTPVLFEVTVVASFSAIAWILYRATSSDESESQTMSVRTLPTRSARDRE